MRQMLPILFVLALLAGCSRGGGDEELFQTVRARALAQPCRMTAEIRADYGDRAYDFTLRLEETAPGAGTVAVRAPETLAEVRVEYSPAGGALRCGELTLETGELAGTGLSPMEALPALLESLRAGAVTELSREGEALCARVDASVREEEPVRHLLYLENGVPVRMELTADGYTALVCAVTEFEFVENEGEEHGEGEDADLG